jgi:hypothetical protein
MTVKVVPAHTDPTSRSMSPILCLRGRMAFGGIWGKNEHSAGDPGWGAPRHAACHCGDVGASRAKSWPACPDDFECRLNILKDAVLQMAHEIDDETFRRKYVASVGNPTARAERIWSKGTAE